MKNTNTALYLQVKDALIQKIQEQTWRAGQLIPTEQELIKAFGVSRTTIRQAINMLVADGLLEKRQGKGTVVKPQQLVGSLGRLKGFAEEVMEKGQVPHSKVLRAEFTDSLYLEKSKLGLSEDENVLVIERIRFADDVPVALERSCWPESIGSLLMEHDLNTAKFYSILEESNILLKRAEEKITAINATISEADALGIRPGEALLEMSRLSFGMNDKPIEYTKTRYRSDQYHYNIELRR